MTSFLGMEIEQEKGEICLRLVTVTYVQEMLTEYRTYYTKKDIQPKKDPIQHALLLVNDDCPETHDPLEQGMY